MSTPNPAAGKSAGARRPLFLAVVLAVASLTLAACGGFSFGGDSASGELSQEPLTIIAATELADLEPAMQEAAGELGFPIVVNLPDGTLTNSQHLANGNYDGQVDTTWFATNRYLDLLGASGKLADSTQIATSPVGFGMNSARAAELGWAEQQPTWTEVADAAVAGEFSFGMTDPSSSNSGFSALVSVATAMADTGNALTAQDITRVAPELTDFFSGQTLTSGSSGWLADTFQDRPEAVDAIINYESVLTTMREDDVDIDVILPSDGVISADYPLSTMAQPTHDGARDQVAALAEWFAENPEKLTEVYLRPTAPGGELPTELGNPLVIELPFPSSMAVTDDLLAAYANELRRPGSTAFVLDTSGSMAGERLAALQETMTSLIDGSAATDTGPVGLRGNENVTLIPFATSVHPLTAVTFDPEDPGVAHQLTSAVDGLVADGTTAIYEALADAYEHVDTSGGTIPSIVLLSDGEVTEGRSPQQFQDFHAGLPAEQQQIPVFVILYGEASIDDMTALADLSGGAVFDALDGDLAEAFKEIRSYQ